MAFQVPVHNYGPGATPEEQAAAARAQRSYPYMGFGTQRGGVYNFMDHAAPKFTMHDGQNMLDEWYARGGANPVQPKPQPNMQPRAIYQAYDQSRQPQPMQQAAPTPQPVSPMATVAPSPVPSAPQLNLPNFQVPQAPAFGGIGTNYGAGFSPMQVTTGIQSGLLPQASINTAVNAAKAPIATPQFAHVSPEQQSTLGTLMGDLTRATGSQNAVDLSRSGSYEQAQMQLAQQRAQSAAGQQWANLGQRFQETNQQAGEPYQNFLWNLLGNLA